MTKPSSIAGMPSARLKRSYSRGESIPALLIRYTTRPRRFPRTASAEHSLVNAGSSLTSLAQGAERPQQATDQEALIQAGASSPVAGKSPLKQYAQANHQPTRFQKTSLHLSIVSGDAPKALAIITAMVQEGADFNQATSLGETALDYAEIYQKRLGSQAGQIIGLLKANGARSGRENRASLFQQLLEANQNPV